MTAHARADRVSALLDLIDRALADYEAHRAAHAGRTKPVVATNTR
jgi:hypothetical protein